ncbi:hypothetical protein SmJEL517_g00173 [Synchytrium microbalum]|uniref:NADP-dependent oxidoreductase domain-containing protein n=1 Tax=Synchytrium microbalum TaxID=1806994 RepID=A0A507CFS4_9FUNG|nr:uncharacterized protein SmJEL517_g00173 [Synchytrium microbalum]TPX38341.1 hypothetical protein SmJEL517_g00173 [Synchytrium microbalum]
MSTTMQYRFLGSSGLKVSEICLGSTFVMPASADQAANIKSAMTTMSEFVAAGGNFIDTADAYGDGAAEKMIGGWLKTQQRDDIVLASKAFNVMGKGVNDNGLSRKHLTKALEGSLSRLGTDYIDLYQCHCWDRGTPIRETLLALNDFVRAGKIRYIGVSNFTGQQLQKTVDLVASMGLEKVVSIQQEYSLLERNFEYDLTELCVEEEVSCIAWSPLKAGWLSGKYTRANSGYAPGSRAESAASYSPEYAGLANEKTFALIDEVTAIAKEVGKSATAVSVRWLLQKPGVAAAIIGARNPEQLKGNLEATTFQLTTAQMERLDSLSAVPLNYPWRFIDDATPNKTRSRH